MAKTTTQYVVTTDNGAQEIFTRVGDVAKFTGISKLTKKSIEAGEYPMITLSEVAEEQDSLDLDLQYDEEFARQEQIEHEDTYLDEAAMGMGEDTEEPTIDEEPVEEPTEEVEEPTASTGTPDLAKDRALKAIEEAMDNVDDNIHPELFDQLCDLEDSINDGIELTDTQADLMTKVLTGTYMDNVSTNTEDDQPTGDLPDDASDIEYPEIGSFDTEKAMKKYIKGLSNSELQEWCELEGATWKPNDHESINRMRMAMAIKALHFPQLSKSKSKKSKSKYADYTTEQLVQMALDNDVEVKDDKGDARILRMYTIMALRNAGIIE